MSHAIRTKPRKALKSPEREVALRKEYIATSKTSLVLKPQGGAHSAVSYEITNEDEASAFTVTGRKYSDRACREFRDSSGLPLFELHTISAAIFPLQWYITLPGDDDLKVAKAAARMSWNSEVLKFTFRNMAASDTKNGQDKDLTLKVKRHGEALAFFDVMDEDRRIADVRESIRHNERLALRRSSRWQRRRPALDLIIMPGVDESLVRELITILTMV